jgi:Flp pilus assembly protein TadG
MTSPSRRDEEGAVAIIVAASLVLFMGILAFVVDVGNIRAQRANAQAAADNAALAAAWRTCVNDASGKAAAELVAADNGYTTGVQVSEQSPAGSGIWTVEIDAAVQGAFSPVFGATFESLSTSVLAKAGGRCSPGGPGKPAVYTSATCTDRNKGFKLGGDNNRYTGDVQAGHDLQWSGSFNKVYGDLYANEDFKVSGNSNQVTNADSPDTVEVEPGTGGDVTYVGTPTNSGTGNTWRSLTRVAASLPAPPFSWTVADFSTTGVIGKPAAEAGQRFAGTSLPSGVLNGLYVIDNDKVELDGRRSGPDGATIVLTRTTASGQFVIKNNNNLQPYRHAQSLLLASFSNAGSGNCDYFGIEITTGNTLGGVLYAPNSIIKVPGDNNRITGATMSRAFEISGKNNVVIAGIGGSLPTSFVEMLE